MKAKANASVRLKFGSEKQLDAVLAALKPEVDASINRRSSVSLVRQELFLMLNVEAEDTVALRAALNAYLRWINSMVDVVSILEH